MSGTIGSVVLRDVTADDLPAFFEHQSDPPANRMAAFTARGWYEFSAHWSRILADPRLIKMTIVLDGQVAGNIVCFGPPEERLVGYWIGRPFWGRGVATRALARFLELVAERPLRARVAKHNVASIRVLEKCGFQKIGAGMGSSDARLEPVEELLFELKGPLRKP